MRYKICLIEESDDGEKILDNEYENAISLYQDGKAYFYPVVSTQGLRFENGKMFFEGDALRTITTAELRDMRTDKGIEKIDISLLTIYYSLIGSGTHETDVKNIMRKTGAFQNIIGVLINNMLKFIMLHNL